VICVIADDLAGAAELGGAALRHGLTAEVQLAFDADSDADVLCVNTDTRPCSAGEAASLAAQAAAGCRQAGVDHIFKKVDSVLRGWVAVELNAMLPALGRERALLVPANPVRGRVVRDGRYWIDGQPLDQTDFARDPEYPVHSAAVLALLGTAGTESMHLLPVGSPLPPRGILVGEAASPADLAAWAGRLDVATLPAGAAEFFSAFLTSIGHAEGGDRPGAGRGAAPRRALFVCGSTTDATRAFLRDVETDGVPVQRMPAGLLDRGAPRRRLEAEWIAAMTQALREQPQAVAAIDRPLHLEPGMPQRLSEALAAAVRQALEEQAVDRLLVTGGATAMALMRELGWSRLVVERQFAPGVVGLRPAGHPGPQVVIKPGSYRWPAELAGAEAQARD